MYKKQAIERLNKINWQNNIRENCKKDDDDLFYEFLRRLAVVCIENKFVVSSPAGVNLAEKFGEEELQESDIETCNEEIKHRINHPGFFTIVVKYYLQISILADKDENMSQYISVYEPIIKLYERGGYFKYGGGGVEVFNAGFFPLENWEERFKDKSEIDISQL